MRIQLSLGLQRSLAWRRKCSQLDVELRRHVGTESAAWVNRINKVVTQKLISRAKTLAHASAPADTRSDSAVPALTSRLMAVPQIQQPQEMFNSAMKPVRKLKPRADLRYDQEIASNLVCPASCANLLPLTAIIHVASTRSLRALTLSVLQAARTMDTLVKEISARFKTFNSRFPRFEALHPFEKSVLNLAVGEANYQRILGNADKLRRRVVKVAHHTRHHACSCNHPAPTHCAAGTGWQGVRIQGESCQNTGTGWCVFG